LGPAEALSTRRAALPAIVEAFSNRKLAPVVGNSPFTAANAGRICELVAKHPMPAIADGRRFAEGGLLQTLSRYRAQAA
jgi:hypothetical protein